MMFQASEFFRALPRILVGIVVAASVLVALVIAWWFAVIGVAVLFAWYGLRRLFHRERPEAPEVIEGEFEKVEEPPRRLR